MATIAGETYTVDLAEDSSTVVFKGALRLSGMDEYAPILELLNRTLSNGAALVALDLRELEFLNSSGITMFSRFVIEARNRSHCNLLFLASEAIPWQTRSLRNLQRLMPSLNIVRA
jgi:hypothetical protein